MSSPPPKIESRNFDAEKSPRRWRIALVTIVFLAGLAFLVKQLHEIQVDSSSVYASAQTKQSLRRVVLPAPRGKIFDRNGVILADNKPHYCIAIFLEELRRPGPWSNTVAAVDAQIDDVARRLDLPREISRKDISEHIYKRLILPLLAWQNIDEKTMARFAQLEPFPAGMEIYAQPERIYPHGKTASHVLGYVGRDTPELLGNEKVHYNVMGIRGRAGVELSRNDILAGRAGGQLVTVDVTGYKHDARNIPALPGKDITLTLDINLQQVAEHLLAGKRGAIVAIVPATGEVLAMASAPDFDPNDLSPAIPRLTWQELNSGNDHPLLNRAISGAYPPGSIFKPLVALAALQSGFSAETPINCDGAFHLGNLRLRCTAHSGHGDLRIREAIERSCNPYFCTVGTRIGYDKIYNLGVTFGLGRRTGIELPGEVSALLPDYAWKRRVRNDSWRAGDTANISIGQGFMLVTPIQMAAYTAALANGSIITPHIIKPEKTAIAPIKISPELKIVREGMREVIHGDHGSGRSARIPGLEYAAKTGTAEYGPRSNRKKHTWMIAFAPYERPEIAVAALVEDGISGSRSAAPLVRAVMKSFFGITEEAEKSEEKTESAQ